MAGITNLNFSHAQVIYDTLLLNELEITAYKADYAASSKKQLIDSIALQNLVNRDLGQILSAYSPVYIRSYGKGSLATASFRGTGANHTQVMWNDFRINSPMLGQTDFSVIPTSFFNRVELFYGGASLEKSEGGIGGNICLSGEPQSFPYPSAYLVQSVGSFEAFSTAAGFSHGVEKFMSDTRVIFQSATNNFPYYNDAIAPPSEMKQRNASYRNGGFNQQFYIYPAKNQTINIASWTQWNHRNIPPIMSKAESNKNLVEYEDDFFSRNTLSYTYRKDKTRLEIRGAWFYENYEYHQEINNNNGATDTLIDSQNKTNGLFVRALYAHSLGHGFLVSTALNYDHDRVRSNNYSEEQQRNSFGGYGKIEKNFIQRIKLNLLLRVQLTDGEILPLMPLFGVNIKLLKKHDLFFRSSVSRNYHLPTLNDLYWNPGGNENLGPEDGYELEAGFNYIYSSGKKFMIKADLTGYATKVNNWIQWIDSGNTYWTPQNIKKVFSRGIESSVNLQGFSGQFNYLFFGQYSYTKTTNRSEQAAMEGTDNMQMIYIPKHTANGYVNISFRGYFIDWQLHFVGAQNTIGSTLPAFHLNDISLGKGLKFGRSALNIRFKVNNIFNTRYQTVSARAMPGRNYEIIIKYTFNQ